VQVDRDSGGVVGWLYLSGIRLVAFFVVAHAMSLPGPAGPLTGGRPEYRRTEGGCDTGDVDDSFGLQFERRGLFSSDVAAYDAGRPGYPERVYELLVEVCGLGAGSDVLEIGPGTGQATGRLLDCGASVTAVELGAELAARLQSKHEGRSLTVEVGAFEDVALEPERFDIVAAATSFHWVRADPGLRRCADLLRPGGWLALWWTFFGDPDRPDPFRDALNPIFEKLAPSLLETFPGAAFQAGPRPYALDVEDRIGEIAATGRFGAVRYEIVSWTGRHTPAEIRAMFGSFSPCLALPEAERTTVLQALEQLATDDFGGLVERPYLTPIYLAQRRT
jgi:SAM-dependent methyltransferase